MAVLVSGIVAVIIGVAVGFAVSFTAGAILWVPGVIAFIGGIILVGKRPRCPASSDGSQKGGEA